MDIEFVPGQRWVSNTESELGLGIVVDTANRTCDSKLSSCRRDAGLTRLVMLH